MERPPHTCLIHHKGEAWNKTSKGGRVGRLWTLMSDVSPGKDQKRRLEQGVRQENGWIVTLCHPTKKGPSGAGTEGRRNVSSQVMWRSSASTLTLRSASTRS